MKNKSKENQMSGKESKTRSQNNQSNRKDGRNDNRSRSKRPERQDRQATDSCNTPVNLDAVRSNDIRWYNQSPLYPLATRIPWNHVLGASQEPWIASDFASVTSSARSVPGVMTIEFVPTIGWADSMNSPVNRAFNQLYADIVSKTTGALQMQQMDLAIMTTGISSIACHIGYAKKVLAAYMNYSSLNYYLPGTLIEAFGFDRQDLIENYNAYAVELTDLISRFNVLAVPAFSYVHARQYSLAHNLYSDAETVFGQIYNFRPVVLYKFDDSDHSLTPIDVRPNGRETPGVMTMGSYLNLIREALQQWENSSVTPIVAGNVVRAYSDSQLLRLPVFDPNEVIVPIVDRNILWQINNMKWGPVDVPSVGVTQDPVGNILRCTPQYLFQNKGAATANSTNYFILNSFDGNTSDEFIMEATRLIPRIQFDLIDSPADSSGAVPLNNCPSELVTRVIIYTRDYSAEDAEFTSAVFVLNASTEAIESLNRDNATEAYTNVMNFVNKAALLSKFRFGPAYSLIEVVDPTADVPTITTQFPCEFRDVGVFTHLHQDALDKLHLAALQSQYWATGFKMT